MKAMVVIVLYCAYVAVYNNFFLLFLFFNYNIYIYFFYAKALKSI